MRARLASEAAVFAAALQFATRLPLPGRSRFTPQQMAAAPGYLPLVGLVIGGLGAAAYLVAATLFPPIVAVLMALAIACALTGALHEDGLADTFDGLGGATRQAALDIMRDSRLGTYGALALAFVLALKVGALAGMAPATAAAALVAGHGLSRASAVLVIATSRYARREGTGAFTADGIGGPRLLVVLITGAACLAGLAIHSGLAVAGGAVLGASLGHGLARGAFERKLGGYTGDCLGATQQISEAGLYLGVLAWA